MANIIYLTKDGLQKLQEELTNLKNVKRVEIAEKLKEAISFGDLSENSEYEDARSEQAQVELRITEVEEQLKHVEIIQESKNTGDKVTMWAVVEIESLTEKDVITYKIVGSTESDILAETPMISNESPVGKALLGKKKWESVVVTAKAGTFEYKILSIK